MCFIRLPADWGCPNNGKSDRLLERGTVTIRQKHLLIKLGQFYYSNSLTLINLPLKPIISWGWWRRVEMPSKHECFQGLGRFEHHFPTGPARQCLSVCSFIHWVQTTVNVVKEWLSTKRGQFSRHTDPYGGAGPCHQLGLEASGEV